LHLLAFFELIANSLFIFAEVEILHNVPNSVNKEEQELVIVDSDVLLLGLLKKLLIIFNYVTQIMSVNQMVIQFYRELVMR